MNIISMKPMRRCDARIDALRAEFGGILADRILEAEPADFLWESRVLERYLGQYVDALPGDESMSEDVSRVAFLSVLDGRWHAGICLVDGEGAAVDLLWKRAFGAGEEAEYAFIHAR
ncbi:MAG: hypothetical protein ACM3ZV_05365 [Bacillota bacterium]|jgi:hypothetical protein